MFFIKEGAVKTVSEDGGTVYSTLGPGNFFGEIALLTSKPRTASSIAVEYCELSTLERQMVHEAMRKFPEFAEHMQEEARQRLSEIDAEHSFIGVFEKSCLETED